MIITLDINFYKYHGTGNDFILIDGMQDLSVLDCLNRKVVEKLCHRRFGIGADGLMVIVPSDLVDFKMIYFNSDGNRSTMCGNGGRCISSLAHDLGYTDKKAQFEAIDGIHDVEVSEDEVSLGMNDVSKIENLGNKQFVINTGSPHFVEFCDESDLKEIVHYGRQVRYSDEFRAEGINVNRVAINEAGIMVATYERGVEDETYSCGTGVTASAICYSELTGHKDRIHVRTRGGDLRVTFEKVGSVYKNVHLIGPAVFVYKGIIEL